MFFFSNFFFANITILTIKEIQSKIGHNGVGEGSVHGAYFSQIMKAVKMYIQLNLHVSRSSLGISRN